MKTKNCVVIDIDEFFLNSLNESLSKLPLFRIVKVFSNYIDGISYISLNPVDLLFINIDLKSYDFKITNFLANVDNVPSIILLSDSTDFAAESYKIGKSIDYLVKPVDSDRLYLSLRRAYEVALQRQSLVRKFDSYIYLKMGRKYQKFDFDKIDYFEAYGIYLKVYYEASSYVINDTISSIEKKLDNNIFARVHKSYLVNLNKVISFSSNTLFLKNTKVPIGVSYREKVKLYFSYA